MVSVCQAMGLKVAACGAVGSVIVFDILTGCQNFRHAAPSRLMDVVFGGMDANDSSCIAFGGHAKQFELVNYSEGQRMHAFPASADVQSVSLSADGTRMAIGKTDQNGPASCKIVQTATAKVYRKWTAADMKTIYSVDLSRSGRMVAYAGYGSVVWVRSVDADELLLEHRFTQLEGSEGPTFIWSVAFSGDESRFCGELLERRGHHLEYQNLGANLHLDKATWGSRFLDSARERRERNSRGQPRRQRHSVWAAPRRRRPARRGDPLPSGLSG